jgi:hypothetical protein
MEEMIPIFLVVRGAAPEPVGPQHRYALVSQAME